MTDYPLEKGTQYTIRHEGENFTRFRFDPIYVRDESLTDGRWATFYSYTGGILIAGSGGMSLMDATLMRIKVPADSIKSIEDNIINSDGGIEVKQISDSSSGRTKVVRSWLKEVSEIKEAQ